MSVEDAEDNRDRLRRQGFVAVVIGRSTHLSQFKSFEDFNNSVEATEYFEMLQHFDVNL